MGEMYAQGKKMVVVSVEDRCGSLQQIFEYEVQFNLSISRTVSLGSITERT